MSASAAVSWSSSTSEQKRALVEGLTTVFVDTCGGEPDGVWIELQEIPAENWGIGGRLQTDLLGLTQPADPR